MEDIIEDALIDAASHGRKGGDRYIDPIISVSTKRVEIFKRQLVIFLTHMPEYSTREEMLESLAE